MFSSKPAPPLSKTLTSPSKKGKLGGVLGLSGLTTGIFGRRGSSSKKSSGPLPDDIAKKIFLSGELCLQPHEYAILWNHVSPPRYVTRCIKFLLDYEKSPEDVCKSMKKDKDSMRYFITCILHSLTVFMFSASFSKSLSATSSSKSEALAIAFEKFDVLRKKCPIPSDKRIYKVLLSMQRQRLTGELPVVSMVVDCAALVPLTILTMANNDAGKDKKVVERTEALENLDDEFPFLYTFLQNLLLSPNLDATTNTYPSLIFNELLKLLSTLPHQLLMSPESIESVSVQALSLIFMTSQFITLSPTSDIKWINKALLVIRRFKSWPLPYSKSAGRLVDMLEREKCSPGYHLRERLLNEDNDLIPGVAANDRSGITEGTSGVSSMVHVLVDREDPLSNTHQALFESVQKEIGRKSSASMLRLNDSENTSGKNNEVNIADTPELTPLYLKIKMLTHVISCDFDLSTSSSPNSKDDPLDLNGRRYEDIQMWYEKALSIHSEALKLPTEDNDGDEHDLNEDGSLKYVGVLGGTCKLYREHMINALLLEINPRHMYSLLRSISEPYDRNANDHSTIYPERAISFSLGEKGKGATSSSMLTQLASEVALANEAAKARLPTANDSKVKPEGEVIKNHIEANPYLPEMPSVNFKFWQCKTAPIGRPSAGQKTKMGYIYYKAEVEQLKAIVVMFLSKVDGVDSSSSSSSPSASAGASSGRRGSKVQAKPILKLVLMGSNLILHKFLCAYAALYEMEKPLLSSVTLKIFICPEGQNDLGRFLAWTDKWYQRHVFTPFATSLPLAPQYSSKETFPASWLDECEMCTTLPVNLLREMLQHYVRCAEHTEMIGIYDVCCWTDEDKILRRLSIAKLEAKDLADAEEARKKEIAAGGEATATSSVKDRRNSDAAFGVKSSFKVPFVTSMEIGILSQVEAYKFNMMKQDKSLKEILMDKDFIKSYGGGEFPNLQISYLNSGLSHNLDNETKEITGEFVSISICNVPEGIRGFHTSNIDDAEKFGTWSGLTLSVRRNAGVLKDVLGKKNKLTEVEANKATDAMKSLDSFGLHSPTSSSFDPYAAKMQVVGNVSVQVTNPTESFYILADGALVGPLKKIVVAPSGLKSGSGSRSGGTWSIPVQSFFPVAAFTREEEGEEGGEGGE